MSDRVVVIDCSEDGDKSIYRYTKEEFAKKLEQNIADGYQPIFASVEQLADSGFLDFFAGYVVIDGDVIVPQSVKVTTKFKL